MTIGIVSSIDYNPHMAAHFRAGFVAGGSAWPGVDTSQTARGYAAGALQTAIATLNSAGAVNFIVTIGGLVTCHAAILNSSKRFISLVGGAPEVSPPFGKFVGCCSMDCYAADQVRLQWLTDPAHAGHFPTGAPFALNSIGLLYNPNSKMAVPEISNWGGGQVVSAVNSSAVAIPTVANFQADFALFSVGIQAIVISADPFFHQNKTNLIAAANSTNKYICYPLRSYRNRPAPMANQPATGRSVLIGPDSAIPPPISTTNAYYRMGVMAAAALSGGNPGLEKLQLASPLPL
jgi:hypothetical protein